MFAKLTPAYLKDPLWHRVLTLSLIFFFVFLADAILSFWVPGYFETTLKSSFLMGIVMGFSSIVGFGADIIFPQILKGITVHKLVLLGILSSIFFAVVLVGGTIWVSVALFLVSMAVWGVYYEFLTFASHQFVADATPLRLHAASWAIIGSFKSLSYFLGPLIAGYLEGSNERLPLYVSIFFALIALLILFLTKKKHDRPLQIETENVSIMAEISHWKILLFAVWPILVMSLFMGLIDSVFWSTGAVYTEELSKISSVGGWFLSLYMLPSLFMGFVVAKWGIYSGKKRQALLFLVLSGVFLSLFSVSGSVLWIFLMVFGSSLCLSIAYPLIDGVYSDIVARMGRLRKHMIGLSSSTVSIAYVVGPTVAGFLSDKYSHRITFVLIGIALIIVSLITLSFTPRKLKLPQKTLEEWHE